MHALAVVSHTLRLIAAVCQPADVNDERLITSAATVCSAVNMLSAASIKAHVNIHAQRKYS